MGFGKFGRWMASKSLSRHLWRRTGETGSNGAKRDTDMIDNGNRLAINGDGREQ